jgi:hypothetical protein
MSGSVLDEVDEREDRDPDDVDEVPIQRGDVDVDGVSGLEPALVVDREQRPEPDHASRHVCAVKAGECKERRPEQVRPNGKPFVHERRELVGLEPQERRAKNTCRPQPELGRTEHALAERVLRQVAILDRCQREHHRQRRHEQHERRRRRDRDVQDRLERRRARGWIAGLVRKWPDDASPLVDQVGGDERREQHALRPDERPDGDLPAIQTGGRVVVPMGTSFDVV